MHLKLVKNKTSIFKHRNGEWTKIRAADIRQLDVVILNEQKKAELINNIKLFLKAKAWYSARRIPRRQEYLLHGPLGLENLV